MEPEAQIVSFLKGHASDYVDSSFISDWNGYQKAEVKHVDCAKTQFMDKWYEIYEEQRLGDNVTPDVLRFSIRMALKANNLQLLLSRFWCSDLSELIDFMLEPDTFLMYIRLKKKTCSVCHQSQQRQQDSSALMMKEPYRRRLQDKKCELIPEAQTQNVTKPQRYADDDDDDDDDDHPPVAETVEIPTELFEKSTKIEEVPSKPRIQSKRSIERDDNDRFMREYLEDNNPNQDTPQGRAERVAYAQSEYQKMLIEEDRKQKNAQQFALLNYFFSQEQ